MLARGRRGFSDAEMQAAFDRLGRTLTRMDDEIAKSGGPWLMGARATLADICVMPTIVRMADLGLDAMWREKPRIARRFEASRAPPAGQTTHYFWFLPPRKISRF